VERELRTNLSEMSRTDPERYINYFESSPDLHTDGHALAEYVKALVAVDRLSSSALLRSLQNGECHTMVF